MSTVIYFSIAYVLLTNAAEVLLRAAALAPEHPVEVLKETTLVALASHATFRVVNGIGALNRWAQAGGPSFRTLQHRGLLMEQEKMATAGGRMKSALFKAAPGGWVFRSPNPWVFGDTPHYLVDDAQKAKIEAVLVPRRPAIVGAVLVGGILAWAIAVATFMWAFAGHEDPTPGDIGLMIVLIVVPLLALLPVAGLSKGAACGRYLRGRRSRTSGFRMPR